MAYFISGEKDKPGFPDPLTVRTKGKAKNARRVVPLRKTGNKNRHNRNSKADFRLTCYGTVDGITVQEEKPQKGFTVRVEDPRGENPVRAEGPPINLISLSPGAAWLKEQSFEVRIYGQRRLQGKTGPGINGKGARGTERFTALSQVLISERGTLKALQA